MICAPYDFSRLKVLTFVTNGDFRVSLAEVLQDQGFGTLHEAVDGANAFVKFKEVGADLVLAGFGTDPAGGLDFVRAIRMAEDSSNPYAPIIMVAIEAEAPRSLEARDSEVNDFLADPLSDDSLGARIVAVIENPKPFIRTATYFGPDRRLWDLGVRPDAAERRGARNQTVGDLLLATPDGALPGGASSSSG